MIINSATCPVTSLASFMNYRTILRLIDHLCGSGGMEKVSIVSFTSLAVYNFGRHPWDTFVTWHLYSSIDAFAKSVRTQIYSILYVNRISRYIQKLRKVARKSIKVLTVSSQVYEV